MRVEHSPFLTLLVLAPFCAFAGWVKAYDETRGIPDFEISQDGGYVLISQTTELDTAVNLCIIKTDTLGNKIWEKQYPCSQYVEAHSIKRTSDEAYIISFFVQSSDSTNGRWLLKIDAQGDTIWSRFFKGGYVFQVAETNDSNYIATGECSDSNINKLWLVKVNQQGKTLWERTLDRSDSSINNGYSLYPISDGGCIVGGRTDLKIKDFPHYKQDIWLLKFDKNGDTIWTKTYGYADGFQTWGYGITSILQTEDKGFLFIAHRNYGIGKFDYDVWLVKTNPVGETLWTRTFGNGPLSDQDEALSLRHTSDGGYIIVGDTRLAGNILISAWLIKTDSNGDSLWARTYDWTGYDVATQVRQTSDGGYILSACKYIFCDTCLYYFSGLLLKTDSLGYVGISEPPSTPPPSHEFEISNPIGSSITLRYFDCPNGFRASVYDATGRKVDELSTPNQSGVLVWGPSQNPGVYFVVAEGSNLKSTKVVLVR
ncbi:T9SS type A sorting domain-containing protein [bacterium]|nr:T9SS type A sorting domain-containing protein [bacterium]